MADQRSGNNNRPGGNRPGGGSRPGGNRPGGGNRGGGNRPGGGNRGGGNRPGGGNRGGGNRPGGGNRGGNRPGGNRGGGNRGRGGGNRGRGGGRDNQPEFDERIIDIARVAKVIKGGRRFAFRVTVIVGDNKGKVGIGTGKSRGVPEGIRKAIERAKTTMKPYPMIAGTIPHEVIGEYGGARVLLKPASPGTGVIAGGSARAVIEAAGYSNILSKSLGSNNKLNVVRATVAALEQLRDMRQVAEDRGKDLVDVAPFWSRKEWQN